MSNPKKKVLFVCMGNICRSPIAEAVFKNICKQRGIDSQWESDSCATESYHTGSDPDRRAMKLLLNHDIEYSHKARRIRDEDFDEFDYIFGMDNANMNRIRELMPEGEHKAEIELLGGYDPRGHKIIRDPYYDSGSVGFGEVYEQCRRSCMSFLEQHKS